MDIAKINQDIATIEKALGNPALNEAMKKALGNKLAALKSQITTAAEASEKKEEAVQDKSDDEEKKLRDVIMKIWKGLENKQVPEAAKGALRKKLKDAEARVIEIEKEKEAAAKAKEDAAKEVKEVVKTVDAAIADVKKGKTVKKGSIKKAGEKLKKVAAGKKERTQAATTHEKKYKKEIDELLAFVKNNPKLKVAYKGYSKDSLERDAKRHALPPGKRISESGNVYYERRRNRVDLTKRKRYPFFEDGGELKEHTATIPNNYVFATPEEVWDGWNLKQRKHFMDDHNLIFEIQKLANKSFAKISATELAEGEGFVDKLTEHIKRGQYKSGGKLKQGNPQGEHYSQMADKKKDAKPVGWRFTEEFINSRAGKRLNLTSSSKPTDEQIEKYKDKACGDGRCVYQEKRADHSDKNAKRYLADGGVVGDGKCTYKAFYKGKEIDVKADTQYAAQKTAATHFKAKKSYDVNVVIMHDGDKEVVHSTAGFKKGGKLKQGNPQGEHYSQQADKKKDAKPVGWRFTEEFINSRAGKRLNLTSSSKPTEEQVDKYKDKACGDGRCVYQEARADHSDKNAKRHLADGGDIEHGYKKGGKIKQGSPQGEHYTEGADAVKHSKPVGWRFTNKFLKTPAAKLRNLTARSAPTKADIAKYKDRTFKDGARYLYQEARADHSDKQKKSGL